GARRAHRPPAWSLARRAGALQPPRRQRHRRQHDHRRLVASASQRRRLIVVSNRGPVTYGRDADGNRVARRGAGGLVTALRGLLEHHDVTWIASATTDEDRVVATEGDGSGIMVAHDPRAYDLYYNVVANPMPRFLHHSL